MANKRKRSSGLTAASDISSPSIGLPRTRRTPVPLPANVAKQEPQPPLRKPSRAGVSANTNPNANPDILDGISSIRASPDGGEVASGGSGLKPRTHNSSRADKIANAGSIVHEATPATEYAATGKSSAFAPAAAEGHGRRRRGVAPRAGAGQGNATEAPLKAAADDIPDRQPGRSKRKKEPAQHVKVDSAESNSATVDAAAQDVTVSSGNAIEEDVGVTVDPEEGPTGEKEEEKEEEVLEEEEEEEEVEEVKEALSRPPPANSDYLPLPWKGRLGYACLNTYLRNANPPVFSSRTCRIASILEHRHPLKDPSLPEHATKNRPDKDQPADVARGQKYVEELGLANARDVIKMLRWNDKYGIKFMRLSSEMFPFASHDEYGYKLAAFAADTLAEVGQVVAELGHRVTTHPGQFTQLGSPRKQVIDAAIRDLEYHDEMLSLLKLPPQQDRDAVMILHLGGAFGDKPATLDRFRENYARLPRSVKNRLVLENDDVVWSVHELLPLCQELNIPFVLDFHHHNIVFDSSKMREGTKDIVELFPKIIETWTRKGITPKMHYSEPCPDAISARSRRKHSPRVMTLPPCPDTMDLMIEAKDKEQAVFELMRTFKLPGFHLFNDVVPHVRQDENKPFKPKPKKAAKRGKKKKANDLDNLDMKTEEVEEEETAPPLIPESEVGMGGPENRVYWPPGMEEWLRPPKRIVKKKEEGTAAPAAKKRKTVATVDEASVNGEVNGVDADVKTPAKKAATKRATGSAKKKAPKAVPTPEPSEEDSEPLSELGDEEDSTVEAGAKQRAAPPLPTRKRSGRVAQRMSYKEEDIDEMSM